MRYNPTADPRLLIPDTGNQAAGRIAARAVGVAIGRPHRSGRRGGSESLFRTGCKKQSALELLAGGRLPGPLLTSEALLVHEAIWFYPATVLSPDAHDEGTALATRLANGGRRYPGPRGLRASRTQAGCGRFS